LESGGCLAIPAGCQAFSANLQSLSGLRLVHVPGNRFEDVDVNGAAAIVTEKDKPGSLSDGGLARKAHRAGARALVKLGGGGSLIFCVADPVEIPCITIFKEDGEDLIRHLASNGPGKITSLKEYDKRSTLISERWSEGTVFLHLDGLHLRTVDWCSPLCRAPHSSSNGKPFTYEDFFEVYEKHKDMDRRFSPEKSKLRRIFESASLVFRSNPAQMGKLLFLGGQRVDFSVSYMRFNRGKVNSNITACAMMLHPCAAISAGASKVEDIQACVAHETVYLALMGQWTKMIGYMAPSLWNFIKCTNADFFGWEADSVKVVKLFTPCTGLWGPEPKENWQKTDPTWRIVDETNVMKMTTRTQGRLLWTQEEATGSNMQRSISTFRSGKMESGVFRMLASCSSKVCCR
jgi:hypothetical protein